MNQKDELMEVWSKLRVSLGVLDSPESHFLKGREYTLKKLLLSVYNIVDSMIAKNIEKEEKKK